MYWLLQGHKRKLLKECQDNCCMAAKNNFERDLFSLAQAESQVCQYVPVQAPSIHLKIVGGGTCDHQRGKSLGGSAVCPPGSF